MKNRRFYQTEELIFKVFSTAKEDLKIKDLARLVGVSRVTIYRHHRTVNRILADYEHYVYQKFVRANKQFIIKGGLDDEIFFYQMLCFIVNNKDVFELFLKQGRTKTIKRMIKLAQPTVASKYHMPKNATMIFEVYNNEILGAIECWKKEGFSRNNIDKVLKQIIYLTNTARERLMPLVN